MQLSEVRAVVTGAASGLGREFCTGLHRAGATVAAFDKDEPGLARLVEDLAASPENSTASPGRVFAYQLDVTREDQVVSTVEKAFSECGPLNVLINSAGIYKDGTVVKSLGGTYVGMPLAQWRTVMEADLTGTFLMCREMAVTMASQDIRPGVIINISSISRTGNAGQANYAAAKAGVVSFTRTLALELAQHGIRAAALAPGFIDTPILAAMHPDTLQSWIAKVPVNRLGTPQEIFKGARFIIECDYYTGTCLEIDGGLTL